MSDVTQILNAIGQGDPQAAGQLLPLVYDELRRLAAQKLAHERPGQTLDATALVHEAYLRLIGPNPEQPWDGKRHFFAAAALAMQRILIGNARRKRRLKHGGGLRQVELDDALPAADGPAEDVCAIGEALEALAAEDTLTAELVRLHYFAGLTIEQAAEVLGLSARTGYRTWAYARAWLFRRLGPDRPAPG